MLGRVRASVAALLLIAGCGRWRFDSLGSTDGSVDASACPTCDQGLVARWRFDETYGTVAVDDIGGHDATLIGSVSWRPGAGRHGGAIELMGGWLETNWDLPLQLPGSFTVAQWVWAPVGQVSNDRYFSNYYWRANGNDDGSFMMGSDQGYGLECYAFIGGVHAFVHSALLIAPMQWQHVACSYDGTQLMASVNGVVGGTGPVMGTLGTTLVMPTAIGASVDDLANHENEYPGMFDDVRVYGRSLDPSELAALAAGG
jgi:hypothetical protein